MTENVPPIHAPDMSREPPRTPFESAAQANLQWVQHQQQEHRRNKLFRELTAVTIRDLGWRNQFSIIETQRQKIVGLCTQMAQMTKGYLKKIAKLERRILELESKKPELVAPSLVDKTWYALNLSEEVKFKFTPHGKQIYRDHYNGLGFDIMPKVDEDGWSICQFHELAHIFGPYLYHGSEDTGIEMMIEVNIPRPE